MRGLPDEVAAARRDPVEGSSRRGVGKVLSYSGYMQISDTGRRQFSDRYSSDSQISDKSHILSKGKRRRHLLLFFMTHKKKVLSRHFACVVGLSLYSLILLSRSLEGLRYLYVCVCVGGGS